MNHDDTELAFRPYILISLFALTGWISWLGEVKVGLASDFYCRSPYMTKSRTVKCWIRNDRCVLRIITLANAKFHIKRFASLFAHGIRKRLQRLILTTSALPKAKASKCFFSKKNTLASPVSIREPWYFICPPMPINFELLDLRAFVAVVDLGGFRKAAQSLNISQSALSRRIQSLEATIGAILLDRNLRVVALTSIGRAIEPLARRIIDEFEQSIGSLTGAGLPRSPLVTIACIQSVVLHFLPETLKTFAERSPSIRFRILDLPAQEAIESVASGETELGINLLHSPRPDLILTPLLDDPYVFVCRKDHPLASKKVITWKDMMGHAVIGPNRRSGNRVHFDGAMVDAEVQLDIRYEFNHPSTALALVASGLGVTVLPRLAIPDPGTELVTKLITEPDLKRSVVVVERRGVTLSQAARAFRDSLIIKCRSLPH